LAVPFRFGVAGPTQTLLRELAEVFGRCCHGALRTENRRERDRSLSHRRLHASAASDEGQDITIKTVVIAVSGRRRRRACGLR
jgi:RNA-splicing ligase RtcB